MPRSDVTFYAREALSARCINLPGSTPEPDDWLLSFCAGAGAQTHAAEHVVGVWGSPARLRAFACELVRVLELADLLPDGTHGRLVDVCLEVDAQDAEARDAEEYTELLAGLAARADA